jgi:conjugal transfer pilus assembly protein TrbC
MITLYNLWFYIKPAALRLAGAHKRSWKKDPIFWLMIYVPVVFVTVTFLSQKELYAAEKAPELPNLQHYDNAEARQKNASRIDAALQAAQSGKMARIPNIRMPLKGVDIGQIANQYSQKALAQKGEDLLIFVSLSMPQEALMRLARQAHAANGVLVMRGIDGGLQKGNWPRAMNLLKPLSDTGASIIIHPDYFRQYKVSTVPTFVLTASQAMDSCEVSTECIQKLQASGDVSLDYVLARWENGKGTLAHLAKAKLTLLEPTQK